MPNPFVLSIKINVIYLPAVMRWYTYFFTLVFYTSVSAQQIVNMEGRRFENPRNGWQGNVEFGANYTQITSTLTQLSNRVFIIHHNQNRNILFVNDVSFVSVDNKNLLNNAFQHFRYIKQGDSVVFPEVFAQLQFNQQLDISLRTLAGAGLRFRVYKDTKSFFYMGNVLMYEHEQNPNRTAQNNLRLSSYASLDVSEWDYLPMTLVAYLQPKITDINDYRVSVEASLLFRSMGKFSFRTQARYVFDADPPPGINKMFSSFNNSLVYSF